MPSSPGLRQVDTEIDWVIKTFSSAIRTGAAWNCPIPRSASSTWPTTTSSNVAGGVFDILQRKGLAARVTTDEEIEAAVDTLSPPDTGENCAASSIAAAQEAAATSPSMGAHRSMTAGTAHRAVGILPATATRVKQLIASV